MEQWLREHKVTEVECLVADLNGIARGKILPAAKFIGSLVEDGLRLPESVFIQTVTGDYADDDDKLIRRRVPRAVIRHARHHRPTIAECLHEVGNV